MKSQVLLKELYLIAYYLISEYQENVKNGDENVAGREMIYSKSLDKSLTHFGKSNNFTMNAIEYKGGVGKIGVDYQP